MPGPNESGSLGWVFRRDGSFSALLRDGASCLDILVKKTVLVVIRVRPMSARETGLNPTPCLKQEDISSLVLQRELEKDMRFAFDCILHQSVSQLDVFDRTGRPLLHKVLEGYNGCLFAYGQTGSGKTYTMLGEGRGDEQGVIPLMCRELFAQIQERQASKTVTVHCSVLEIYNERIKDLLNPTGEDLQIREEAAVGGRGIYVEGLSDFPVGSVTDIVTLIEKSQARRAIGQTNMNEHSSRSHAVVTLRIESRDINDREGITLTVSKLSLVDLAGSERQRATGATGDRLKEGAQINLSLSALGNVINALTEKNGRHVPYRDSRLTRLLQDSLGGNAYTVIVCNVSPAKVNAEETLSSLRFAERAKKIQNVAKVNRDPKSEQLLRLAQENKALHAQIERLESHIVRLEQWY